MINHLWPKQAISFHLVFTSAQSIGELTIKLELFGFGQHFHVIMNHSADLLKREDWGLSHLIRLAEKWNKGLYWLQPSGLQSDDKHLIPAMDASTRTILVFLTACVNFVSGRLTNDFFPTSVVISCFNNNSNTEFIFKELWVRIKHRRLSCLYAFFNCQGPKMIFNISILNSYHYTLEGKGNNCVNTFI